jgi:hypothetical protein
MTRPPGAWRLQRHPLPVTAWFRHSLVVAWAFPADLLETLLPPGMTVDRYEDVGFVAAATVQTERLRPSFLPRALGRDFLLTGYRVFVRAATPDGRTLRGLHILRSDTDRRLMRVAGNLLTHYRYRLADASMTETDGVLAVRIASSDGMADLEVRADLSGPEALPDGSPFQTHGHARRFAGPLPWTFDHEPQTGSLVLIRGVRDGWSPRMVPIEVREAGFVRSPRFRGVEPVLASAFHVSGVDYRWERGVRLPLRGEEAA